MVTSQKSDRKETLRLRRVTIAGVGLLGGSVAMAVRRFDPTVQVVGLVRNRDKGKHLVATGLLDRFADDIDDACSDSDCVVVATPVDRLAQIVIDAAKASPDDCLITDVGSTKADIVHAVASEPLAVAKFVAAHPIAGGEKSGAEHASESLFDDKPVVLTPDDRTPESQLKKANAFWMAVGGRTVVMSADQHDVHLAAISHVPHLVSALVAKMVPASTGSETDGAEPPGALVGSGWRDITRVAAGDPEMWTAICAANRTAILSEMDRLASGLHGLKSILQAGDDQALFDWLNEAKQAKQNII
jgi:prephenate dehydrogenase